MTAHINAIGTATPDHDIHGAFIGWAAGQLAGRRDEAVFRRMAARAGIGHRWSVLPQGADGGTPVSPGGFYDAVPLPGTDARMRLYATHAPALALSAIADLAARLPGREPLAGITHLVVASCTGFVAPGIDQIIARELDLAGSVERLMIGFMGCYAAVVALRSARHIVRSQPGARVLVVTVELSTLHLRETDELEALLAMLQFGDGAAAALVTADAAGLAMGAPFAATLPDSEALIRWDITDHGFAMHLSGEVPGRITAALQSHAGRPDALANPGQIDAWAVHAGGRSILDAVAHGLGLPDDALDASRTVLAENGNMSSATLMFVLARLLARQAGRNGIALAFGPGLAAEGFTFGWATR